MAEYMVFAFFYAFERMPAISLQMQLLYVKQRFQIISIHFGMSADDLSLPSFTGNFDSSFFFVCYSDIRKNISHMTQNLYLPSSFSYFKTLFYCIWIKI